jgi:hypothetical protein
MNLLQWYLGPVFDSGALYNQLGTDMRTNNWLTSSRIADVAKCFCSVLPECWLPEPVCAATIRKACMPNDSPSGESEPSGSTGTQASTNTAAQEWASIVDEGEWEFFIEGREIRRGKLD